MRKYNMEMAEDYESDWRERKTKSRNATKSQRAEDATKGKGN